MLRAAYLSLKGVLFALKMCFAIDKVLLLATGADWTLNKSLASFEIFEKHLALCLRHPKGPSSLSQNEEDLMKWTTSPHSERSISLSQSQRD